MTTLQQAREDLVKQRHAQIASLNGTRTNLLKELWTLLRFREDLGYPLPLDDGSGDLFAKRFELPTSIHELQPETIQPLVSPPPPSPAEPEIVTDASMLAHPQPGSPPRPSSPEPEYPVPPSEMVNNGLVWPSINREKNPIKIQRKRERERIKGRQSPEERDKDKDKDGFTSMEFVRWVANIRANPLYIHLSRKPSTRDNPPPLIARQSVTKCLSTNDWFIAIREIKLLRLSSRINTLQDECRWSYRQPRRQKEPAHYLAKTHWDYLREEGRWMRTDFREERKLKAVIGYKIGQELKEVFVSGESPLKKRRVGESDGISESIPTKMEVDEAVDLTGNVGIPSVPINADLSGFQELEEVPEQKEEILDGVERVEDVLEDYEAMKEEEAMKENGDDVEKDFDVSVPSSSVNANGSLSMEVDIEVNAEDDVDAEGDEVVDDFRLDIPDIPPEPKIEIPTHTRETEIDPSQHLQLNGDLPPDPPPELKTADDNPNGPTLPTLPFENEEKDSDAGSNNQKEKGKGKDKEKVKLEDPVLRAIRDPILQMGIEEFALPVINLPFERVGEDAIENFEDSFPQMSMNDVLISLFPELKPYTALPPAPLVVQNPNSASNKSSNLRTVPLITGKRDPGNFRRIDETVTKVAQVTKHMKGRAILVSALNTGENYNPRTKEWDGYGEMFIQPSNSTALNVKNDEQGSSLFVGKKSPLNIWPTPATSSFYHRPPVIIKTLKTPTTSAHPTPAPSEAGGTYAESTSGISLASHPQPPHPQSVHISMGRPIAPWTELEDNILKSLAERYGNHWGLIHELFRSDRRVRTSGERERGLWELVERYAQMVNAAPKVDPDLISNQPGSRESSVRAGSVQASASVVEEKGMKTRGVKRRATTSGAGPSNGPAGSPSPSNITVTSANGSAFKVPVIPGWESRRRRRHLNIGEAIKKIIKKREADAKTTKQNKLTAASDSHNMIVSKTARVPTPAELSKAKWERDQKEQAESQRQREYLQLQYHQRLRQQASALTARQNQAGQAGAEVPAVPVSVNIGANAAQIRPAQGQLPQTTNINLNLPVNISQHGQQQQAAANAAQQRIPGLSLNISQQQAIAIARARQVAQQQQQQQQQHQVQQPGPQVQQQQNQQSQQQGQPQQGQPHPHPQAPLPINMQNLTQLTQHVRAGSGTPQQHPPPNLMNFPGINAHGYTPQQMEQAMRYQQLRMQMHQAAQAQAQAQQQHAQQQGVHSQNVQAQAQAQAAAQAQAQSMQNNPALAHLYPKQ